MIRLPRDTSNGNVTYSTRWQEADSRLSIPACPISGDTLSFAHLHSSCNCSRLWTFKWYLKIVMVLCSTRLSSCTSYMSVNRNEIVDLEVLEDIVGSWISNRFNVTKIYSEQFIFSAVMWKERCNFPFPYLLLWHLCSLESIGYHYHAPDWWIAPNLLIHHWSWEDLETFSGHYITKLTRSRHRNCSLKRWSFPLDRTYYLLPHRCHVILMIFKCVLIWRIGSVSEVDSGESVDCLRGGSLKEQEDFLLTKLSGFPSAVFSPVLLFPSKHREKNSRELRPQLFLAE